MTIVFGLFYLATIAAFGFAAGQLFSTIRLMFVNSVFSDSTGPGPFYSWLIPVGIIGSLIFGALYTKWNHRFSGKKIGYAFIGPLPLWLLGLTLGLAVSTSMWVAPDAVGTAVDPTFGHDEKWGIGAWALYSAKWWLPAATGVLFVIVMVLRVFNVDRLAKRRSVIEELLTRGTFTEGTVTKAPTISSEASRVFGTVAFSFPDAQGQTRHAQITTVVNKSNLPWTGSTRPVLFDPTRPGDLSRIAFSVSGGTDVDDFGIVDSKVG